MNVLLTPELETLVREKVQSGQYASTSEVINEALRLLNARDSIQQQYFTEMKREIAVGLIQIDRGEGTTYDKPSLKTMFDGIKEQGRKRMKQKEARSAIGMTYDGPLMQSMFEDFLKSREQEASDQKKDV